MNKLKLTDSLCRRKNRETVYRVPEFFFENLEKKINEKISERKVSRRSVSSHWVEWIIAVAVISVVCFSRIHIVNDKPDFATGNGLKLENLFYCDQH